VSGLERSFALAARLEKIGMRADAELVRHVDTTTETLRAVESLVDTLELLVPAATAALAVLDHAEVSTDWPEGAVELPKLREALAEALGSER
jgi:hypothetical protein